MIDDGYPVVEKWKAEPGARAGVLTLINKYKIKENDKNDNKR